MPINTIEWEDQQIKIIDQTKLPWKLTYLWIKDVRKLWEAIHQLKVRGAPALGIAGALGVVLGMQNFPAKNYSSFKKELNRIVQYLSSSRPTAVNLSWALKRMSQCAQKNHKKSINEIKESLKEEAFKIIEEDKVCNRLIAKNGSFLISDGDSILTHCNAGALATFDYGTALGIIYRAKEEGKKVKVYVDETRPLLQGARLTAWELLREGIETTLICDSMAGEIMREKRINKVIVGADRVASNGDVANKIGTYTLSVLAKENGIPFYVACPFSTIDLSLLRGEDIPIEQRDPQEITSFMGKRFAPLEINVYNPAFDITPARYISAIITEKGVHQPPYKESLKKGKGPKEIE